MFFGHLRPAELNEGISVFNASMLGVLENSDCISELEPVHRLVTIIPFLKISKM